MNTQTADAHITVLDDLPIIRIEREFAATPAEVVRAHTDPHLFAQWIGPEGVTTRIVTWDARDGGSFRYISSGAEFRGCFHTVADDRIIQTFSPCEFPDGAILETITFEPAGGDRTKMVAVSLWENYEIRGGALASGMSDGVQASYRKLDGLLAAGSVG